MSPVNNTRFYQAIRWQKEISNNDPQEKTIPLELIGEEPFLIRIDEKPYSVVMRTPGEEVFHAAGFCLSEGIANSPDDFKTIGYDKDIDPNIIDIWLTPERHEKIHHILERKIFISQTSCGICGKEMVKDLYQKIKPVTADFKIKINKIFDSVNKLSESQQFYQSTRGSHAAIILDEKIKTISFAEDVGRHNALDKAVGKGLMDNKLSGAKILVLSSRISYELIQKAARARIPVIISNSRPTALAVDMGKSLNMTLAFPEKDSGLVIVCGEQRIIR